MRLASLALVAGCAAAPASPKLPALAKATWPREVPLAGMLATYVASVDIGGESFGLQVDTGSPLLAVAGANCKACGSAGSTAFYQPRPKVQHLDGQLDYRYDEGELGWTGSAYVDRVSIDGAGTDAPVFAMSTESGMVAVSNIAHVDGILGMLPGEGSWVDAMVKAGMPREFAIHKCDTTGTLWLGGAPAGSATWLVAMPDYAIELDAIDIGSAHIVVPSNLPRTAETPPDVELPAAAVVDSGIAGLIVPQATFDAIVAELDRDPFFHGWFGSAALFFSQPGCVASPIRKALDRLPPITIEIDGNRKLTVPAAQSYALPVDDDKVCPMLAVRDNYIAIGDVLMRSNTVIFKPGDNRMGLVPAAPCSE